MVYTPLHGTGRVLVTEVLAENGFCRVAIVEQRTKEDGDFPTVFFSNPEIRRVLELGIRRAEQSCVDIVLRTESASDRVGVAVSMDKGYQLLNGNQIGALLMVFLLAHTDLSQCKKLSVVETVVMSELGTEIVKKSGLNVFSTMTGFKFIGEKITQFEQANWYGNDERDYTFLLGYKEFYGYLSETHVHDKDAVISSLLICEMTKGYKSQSKTLLDRMNKIYKDSWPLSQ